MTEIEKVRLLINDKTVPYHFTDAEIQAFLDMGGSVLLAASYALESWAAAYAASADSEKIGDYAYTQKAVSNMITLAKKYREEDEMTPYMTWAEMDLSSVGETTEMGE